MNNIYIICLPHISHAPKLPPTHDIRCYIISHPPRLFKCCIVYFSCISPYVGVFISALCLLPNRGAGSHPTESIDALHANEKRSPIHDRRCPCEPTRRKPHTYTKIIAKSAVVFRRGDHWSPAPFGDSRPIFPPRGRIPVYCRAGMEFIYTLRPCPAFKIVRFRDNTNGSPIL